MSPAALRDMAAACRAHAAVARAACNPTLAQMRELDAARLEAIADQLGLGLASAPHSAPEPVG